MGADWDAGRWLSTSPHLNFVSFSHCSLRTPRGLSGVGLAWGIYTVPELFGDLWQSSGAWPLEGGADRR